MGATDLHGWPTPDGIAAPLVHVDMTALADAIDLSVPVEVNDIAAMNALTPVLNLKVLVKSMGYKLFTYDGTGWKTDKLFVDVNTSDANWNYLGGLYIDYSNPLAPMADLRLRLARAAGGSVALTATFIQAFAGLIPAGYRPRDISVTDSAIIQTSAGADKWGAVFRIDKSGHMFLRTDSGSSSVIVGDYVFMRSSWVI